MRCFLIFMFIAGCHCGTECIADEPLMLESRFETFARENGWRVELNTEGTEIRVEDVGCESTNTHWAQWEKAKNYTEMFKWLSKSDKQVKLNVSGDDWKMEELCKIVPLVDLWVQTHKESIDIESLVANQANVGCEVFQLKRLVVLNCDRFILPRIKTKLDVLVVRHTRCDRLKSFRDLGVFPELEQVDLNTIQSGGFSFEGISNTKLEHVKLCQNGKLTGIEELSRSRVRWLSCENWDFEPWGLPDVDGFTHSDRGYRRLE